MRKILQRNEFYLLLVILVFSLAITIVNPAFFTIENMFYLLRSSSGMATRRQRAWGTSMSAGPPSDRATS